MYDTILVPIDLAHADELRKAIAVAGDLARQWGARVVLVGVTEAAPSAVAHDPQEFRTKLAAFAARTGEALGVTCEARAYTAHDPATQIDEVLVKAVSDTGADCVVMASHAPSFADAILPSHGGRLATHTPASIFLVR